MNLIIKKIAGLMLVFAIIVVWAIYSYSGNNASVLTSSGEIISRN